ncbi:hypothetical protein L1987_53285 [Smallanthus sonchifolius]|uniref:Uncharacterized protein n=1 Tax=Smallanthus sonchifolius TaxID=185202 RepID=A0ACB9EW97_9ASTR|nr:hypothetical protein L1987_53285 [Smallanthus sonchifolius]
MAVGVAYGGLVTVVDGGRGRRGGAQAENEASRGCACLIKLELSKGALVSGRRCGVGEHRSNVTKKCVHGHAQRSAAATDDGRRGGVVALTGAQGESDDSYGGTRGGL